MKKPFSRILIFLLASLLASCSGALALRVKDGSSMIYGYADGGDLGDTLSVKIGTSPGKNTMTGRGTGKAFYILNVMPGDYYINDIRFGVLSHKVGRVKAAPQEPGSHMSVRVTRPGFYYVGAIKINKDPTGRQKYVSNPINGPGVYSTLDEIYGRIGETPWGEKIEKELKRLDRRGY